MWRVEYGNDAGPDDDYYFEWWTVTNGRQSFRVDTEEFARWICDVLNRTGAEK